MGTFEMQHHHTEHGQSTVMVLAILLLTTFQTSTVIHAQTEVTPESRCEFIQVPMCNGLVTYNSTKLPNRFGHTTQTEVYWALQPWWPFIDAGCSDNLRNFLCGLYLPRCAGDNSEPHYPCQETCKKAKVRCQKVMRQQNIAWSPDFKCNSLLPKSSKMCVKPERERKKKQNKEYVLCQVNKLPMCQGIPFPQGSLPNMFLQADQVEIDIEMRQFQPLISSGCSKKLRLFLCGVYMPFCVPGANEEETDDRHGGSSNNHALDKQPDVPFVVPCRELCQEVYDQCSREYQQRTLGLPWPAKFHCHRFPSYVDRYTSNTTLGKKHHGLRTSRRGTSVPCTMPPYNYDGN